MTAEEARRVLSYKPETGELYWRVPSRNGVVKAGDLAGHLGVRGYWQIRAFGKAWPAHRVCWLLQFGAWPVGEIDHINGVKTDNRLCNLRDVSKAVNQQNKHRPQSNSTSGVLGASKLSNGKWRANIRAGGKNIYLGVFATAEDAGAAYQAAKQRLHA
jgi:hypothetical protein